MRLLTEMEGNKLYRCSDGRYYYELANGDIGYQDPDLTSTEEEVIDDFDKTFYIDYDQAYEDTLYQKGWR